MDIGLAYARARARVCVCVCLCTCTCMHVHFLRHREYSKFEFIVCACLVFLFLHARSFTKSRGGTDVTVNEDTSQPDGATANKPSLIATTMSSVLTFGSARSTAKIHTLFLGAQPTVLSPQTAALAMAEPVTALDTLIPVPGGNYNTFSQGDTP